MLKAFANAKINLLLDVTGRDENGYHTVNNVMQTVSLCDTVNFSCKCEGISIEYDDGYPVNKGDICLKAATEYQRLSGQKINAEVKIEKVIPTAAGLGGNSSAAAAVLALLDREYGFLNKADLMKIAASLGADVPFFLFGGTAVCEHYGEIITPIKSCPKMYVVIAKQGEKSSTAEMYKRIDDAKLNCGADFDGMLAAIDSGDAEQIISKMYNVFEAVWQEKSVTELKNIMISSGAKAAMLSGSGPAVFGIFGDENIAEDCCNTLCVRGISAYLCETTDSGIVIE